MSFKGEIEARCPKGCEPFQTEVWSFIHADQSPDLRLALKFRECNLLLCPACELAFFPEAAYVYFEPRAELLAFVFPESYREKEAYWKDKMSADFAAMRSALGEQFPVGMEPEIFFGADGLAELLESEDYRGEECEVMEFIAKEMGLSLYLVSPGYARRNGVPGSLPFLPAKGEDATCRSVIRGLEKLLLANDSLQAYRAYLARLKSAPMNGLPPRLTVARS